MDVMSMAAKVSLSDLYNEIAGVEGPFGQERQSAVIILRNGYALSLFMDGEDTAEILVMREIYEQNRSRRELVTDYSTPVTSDVKRKCTANDIREALRVLRGLTNDPYDMRVSRPGAVRR